MNNYIAKFKQSSLLKNSFWAVFGNGLGYGVLLISGILIARFLGKGLYGEYGLVKTTMFNIAAFATFGLGYTSTKFIADYVENNKDEVYSVFRSSVIITLFSSSSLALLLIIFSKQLALFLEEPTLQLAFQFLGGIIIVKALSTTYNGILAGLKKFKIIAITNVISGCLMLVIAIPFTYYYGLKGALAALFLSQFCNMFLNALVTHKESKRFVHVKKKTNYYKKLIKFSFPVVLQEFSYMLCNWGGAMMLVKLSSLDEMGLYTAVAQWVAVISIIPGLLSNVVLSYLSGTINNLDSHNKIIKAMITINLVTTLIPYVCVFFLAPWISSFYGSSFEGMTIVLRFFTFVTILTACSNVLNSEFIAQGRTYTLFALRFLRDILTLILLYLFLSHHEGVGGANDYAIVSVITQLLYFIMICMMYKKMSVKSM